MLVQVLLVSTALVASVISAPTNCVEFCDDQVATNSGYNSAGQSRSSYNSYAKSSYDHRLQRLSNGASSTGVGSASNLGSGTAYGRLENLDENVISGSNTGSGIGINLNRPGNWQDEKHYVTDDGRGQMRYRAGQTVTDNGYSKFAEHSYSYGSHDSHAPLSNSQVLSTAEFNQELQNMRSRIASFMGSFHVGTESVVSANLLADFKNKANVISSQLNDVCNQVDIGSSMHQQMQQMQQQFQKDVEKLQHQMEQKMYFQSTSSGSSNSVISTSVQYPSPVYVGSTPSAPITTYPSRPYPSRKSNSEESLVQQRVVEEEITKIQQQVSTFYSSFNRPDTDIQYQTNLNTQAELINQKLASLKIQAIQNESARARLEQLKTQFETYISQIRSRIQEIEDRQREEEVKRIEAEMQAETQRYEETLRVIEQKKLRIKQQEEENKRIREEAERIKIQEEKDQRIREESERLKLQEEEARRQRAEFEHQQLIQQQEEEANRQREQAERLQRLQVEAQQQQQQQQQQHQQSQVSGSVEITNHYDHSIKAIGGQQQQQQQQIVVPNRFHPRPQPVMNAHVDLTALTSRLQQELNRLQNEINNFNTYTMRLTSANSQSVIAEAEHQADSLRQSINSLCETSGRYQNQNIHTSAEELSRRFEEMFRSLQSQAANYSASGSTSGFAATAGFSSHSSYGSSGAVSSVRAPTITNVEYEHSKSAEVEISRRPVSSSSSQRYASGQQQVECVEVYAGQPCVEQQPLQQQQQRRYRRQVGGK